LEQRIQEHNFKKYDNYTSTRLPVKLVYSQQFSDINDAIAAERKIKGWSRKKKEALISNNFDLLHDLAECKNETNYKNKKY
jgi:putative endonuclease